jgi:membrane-associated protein
MISGFGAWGVLLVTFAETALLVGFFLPGDSLLFTAGILAATSTRSGVHLALSAVIASAAAGTISGAQVGFVLGQRGGGMLLRHTKNRHVHAAVRRSTELLARYGHGKAIVLARFLPVVRTVLNPLAGLSGVPTRTFLLWQVIGGLGWSIGVTLIGFFLGSTIPNVDEYLLPIVAVIVVVSLIPVGTRIYSTEGEPVQSESGPPPR